MESSPYLTPPHNDYFHENIENMKYSKFCVDVMQTNNLLYFHYSVAGVTSSEVL